MEFEVMEVKLLRGKDEINNTLTHTTKRLEYCDSLSLRLEAIQDPNTEKKWLNKFTIHAVVPWHIAERTPSIGDRFSFEALVPKQVPAGLPPNSTLALDITTGNTKTWCQDSACKLRNESPHKFGKGCRLWDAMGAIEKR